MLGPYPPAPTLTPFLATALTDVTAETGKKSQAHPICRVASPRMRCILSMVDSQHIKSQATNLKSQISNLKPQTSNLKSQTSNVKHETLSFRSRNLIPPAASRPARGPGPGKRECKETGIF